MDEPRICGREGCGKKLLKTNKSGFCFEHWYDSKTGDAKFCSVQGCGTKLRVDNKSGVCKEHKHSGSAPPSPARRPSNKTTGAQPRAAVPHKNGKDAQGRSEVALRIVRPSGPAEGDMLMVTEKHLDNYLLKLPLERKTALVQQDLEAQLNG